MTETVTKIVPRLKTRYAEEIKQSLRDEFKYVNVNQVPGTGIGSRALGVTPFHVKPDRRTDHGRRSAHRPAPHHGRILHAAVAEVKLTL